MSDLSDSVRCSRCRTRKAVSEFRVCAYRKSGLFSWCIACSKAYDTKRQHAAYRSRKYEATVLNRVRQRAKKIGVPFDLILEDIVLTELCPVCGVRMVVGNNGGAPSVDRIIPALGYTKRNVIIICGKCNVRKSDSSPEDMYRIADWLYALRKERGLDVEPQ